MSARRSTTRLSAVLLAAAIGGLIAITTRSACADDEIDRNLPRIERIAPGTVIDENAQDASTRLVLLAKSRVGAGDLEETSSLVRKYASLFHLAILAHVACEEGSETPHYRLTKIAVGLCLPINGQNIVLSSDTQQQLGAKLDFVARQILARSERSLDDVVLVARHSTLAIFDAKAVVLIDGEHRDMVVRHMVWVDPSSGQLGTLVWLLGEDARGEYHLPQSVMQALPPHFVEDRLVHVKSSEFKLGIPSRRAFAIVNIPRGVPIPVTPALARLAASRTFTAASLAQFAREVNEALQRRRRGD